ncbi:Uma2 family endonuclease [Streptomyces erythrochromogenes]|uniref:Uma2 family endonuclease n=1 Tax=Streptomyces erythrochromogenes TaxID=285574 RepID=UPI0036CA62F6
MLDHVSRPLPIQHVRVTPRSLVSPTDPDPALDRAVWRAWLAIEPPETFRAEIVEGRIEMWRIGTPPAHALTANRLRDRLASHLGEGPWAAYMAMHVIGGHQAWAPDVFVAPDELAGHVGRDGAGVAASAVALVAEVVAPGRACLGRDRSRKRRAYARAGIAVYVIVDDYDGHGTVSVLTGPVAGEERYAAEVRVPYGTPATVPEGPAKGFAIGEDVTGPGRAAG